MATRFPLTFEVDLHRHDSEPIELHAGDRPRIVIGPPPELGGSDAWWSPEQLFVSATAGCYAATFYALAQRAELRVGSFRCKAHGVLDRTEGAIAFTSVTLEVHVRVLGDDVARTRTLLEDTKKRCFVANSLRCLVELVADVEAS